MNHRYPVSSDLKYAIDKIFDNEEYGFVPRHGYEALGAVEGSEWVFDLSPKKDVPDDVSFEKRISFLKRDLEDFVELNGRQVDEFEGYDLRRLADEARATLLALHSIHYFFPDIDVASKEEYEAFIWRD